MTITLCAINFATVAVAAVLPVTIHVKDKSGATLKNVTVATENLATTNIQVKTNENGIAKFDGKCDKWRTKDKARAVKVCAVEKSGKYKKTCIKLSGCEHTITMENAPRDPNKKYPSPQQMAELAVTWDGKLQTYPVCAHIGDSDYKYPSKVKPVCIQNIFNKTKVQMLQGIELAKIYTKKVHNHNIVCSNTYRHSGGSDYLQCTSTDKQHVYEFRFKNLDKGSGFLDTGGDEIQDSVANALCRLPNGKYNEYNDFCQKGDETEKICPEINTNAQKFGWATNYYKSKKVGTHTQTLGNGQVITQDQVIKNICQFDFKTKDFDAQLRADKKALLDPRVFQNIQVKSNNDTILLLTQYVRTKIGSDFKSLKCDSGFSKMYRDSSRMHTDDVITCHLATYSNSAVQDVDFVFDDVKEKSKTKTEGGKAGMSCIANDGSFDGRTCTGIGEIQCKALNYKLKGGTTYDKKTGICKMKAAADADDLAKFEKGLEIGGMIVGTVVLTVATAGAGSVAMVALVSTGVSAVAQSVGEVLKEIRNDHARDFIVAAEMCDSAEKCDKAGTCTVKCNPNSSCAKNTLVTSYAEIEKVMDGDDQLASAVSMSHDKLFEKITESCVDEKFVNDLQKATSTLSKAIVWVGVVEIGADLVSFGPGGLKTLAKGAATSRNVYKLTSKSKKARNALKAVARWGEKSKDAAKGVKTAAKAADKADDVADATKTASKTTKAAAKARTPEELRDAVDPLFDSYVAEVKSKPGKSVVFSKDKLTDAEWKKLNESLAKDNVRLVQKGDAMSLEPISLRETDAILNQKLSKDVLTLQTEQGMAQKVEAYENVLETAKKELNPEEYEAFDNMVAMEIGRDNFKGRYRLEHELEQAADNLYANSTMSDAGIEQYLSGYNSDIAGRQKTLDALRAEHPEASKFFDNNIDTLRAPEKTLLDSDKLELKKRIDMTKKLSESVDSKALKARVQQFKDNIIANFPKDMYEKAKNWKNLSLQQRADLVNELQPFLQRIQGCSGTNCTIGFYSAADIGGAASYSGGYLSVSHDLALNMDFNQFMMTMAHENIHLGQEAGVSLSKEIVTLSNENYVKAVAENLRVNQKIDPTEVEAYMTKEMFDNFLNEVAQYHGW